jgi:hypothetical protein
MSNTVKPRESKAPQDIEEAAKPSYTRDDYNAVAGAAQLAQIMLVSSAFEVKPNYWRDKKEDPDKIKHNYDWDIRQYEYNAKEGAALAHIEFKIDVRSKRKNALNIRCAYLVVYAGIENMHPEAVEAFMRRIGRFAAYPYFRAHVSQLSWESNTGLPVLPTIRS